MPAAPLGDVFKALADPTRRDVLDRLRRRDGQTLSELGAHLEMARQSLTQHVEVLVAANLVSTVRRGRERRHYLNPVPLNQIQERWIDRFAAPRLRALSAVKRTAEESPMPDLPPTFVYVTYIESSPERVWEALTDAELTAAYWGHRNVSDWQPGSRWEHRRTDGSEIADVTGEVIESAPPWRLVVSFRPGSEDPLAPASRVSFGIEPGEGIVRLTVTHERFVDLSEWAASAAGWPAVLANLKSWLETGRILPQAPWEMSPPVPAGD
jgi:uncharacterized protein YndB with AHSA1/START domain/DNA-binding transcriptional ArsR family regulator